MDVMISSSSFMSSPRSAPPAAALRPRGAAPGSGAPRSPPAAPPAAAAWGASRDPPRSHLERRIRSHFEILNYITFKYI